MVSKKKEEIQTKVGEEGKRDIHARVVREGRKWKSTRERGGLKGVEGERWGGCCKNGG